ncbi:hypothetical protein GQ43DRAFT_437404 [Delitschia confertaspora ATCC 74209]|uniref:Asl1-like glycosyl hydrolase catalytic domain-containing protein n=1 Tax=Delitschia confertaspora ATCC 74209 TaxID=1513339 RepID=A0A9P4JX13_9PLEO|nr:hypothetical protein GQ43DRAFT_437404 [Delitschia confertaspora ATCC 74209]
MHTSIQLGLLTLASTAFAIPHYGHGKFHSTGTGHSHAQSSEKAYPTDGWNGYQNTTVAAGTGIHTTSTESITSTSTIYSTVYLTRPSSSAVESSSAVADAVSSGAPDEVCGPATVTVTATNQVTITVPAGGSQVPSSSSTPVVAPSSSKEVAPAVPSSVAPVESAATSSVAPVESATTSSVEYSAPAYSTPAVSSSTEEGKGSISISSLVNKGQSTEASLPTYEASIPVLTPTPSESYSAPASSAPASSAYPSSGSPSYSGTKRGLSYNDINLLSKFSAGKFGWTMNWAQAPGDWSKLNGASFIPMMHNPIPGPENPNVKTWLQNVDTAVKQGSTAVMGFNEVDQEGQAKMSVSDACNYWKEYMEPIFSAHPDVTVIGPSVTNGPAPMGLDWLERFAKECPSALYHVTHIHFYDIYNEAGANIQKGTADRFKDHVKEAISKFGKPVFVSEFGLVPGSASDEEAAKFLKECMQFLDGEDQVKGYAYFMAKDVPMGLIKANSLSATGEVYVS